MRDSIRQKILYANVLGVPDPSLVNMRNLTRLGITSQPKPRRGLPYGVSPDDLSEEEKQWMIDTATQAGARARQASPAIDAMRQGPQ
jgi:hypothetical protein